MIGAVHPGLRGLASILFVTVAVGGTGCGRVWFDLTPLEGDPPDALPCEGLCRNEHGGSECKGDQCAPTCASGWLDCDGNLQNGCETNVADQMESCGGCALACTNPSGSTGCDAGLCAPVCTTGSADCDENPQNGCETTLATSRDHCGGCETSCTNAHGETRCVSGACSPTCQTGYVDCDGDAKNGCETNTTADPDHCGGCGAACGVRETCIASRCQPDPCNPGTADCDLDAAHVCETNTSNDVAHCGFCSNACTLPNATPQCVASGCAVGSCNPTFGNCDGQASNGCETNTNTSVPHCGGCAMACTNEHGGQSCSNGGCVPSCSTGFGNCDGNARNGCETGLNSLANCGGCNTPCTTSVAGATADCSSGACIARCNDLSGVWAMRVRAQTSWPNSGFIASGSGSHDYIARVQLTQAGLALTGTAAPCGRTVAPFQNDTTGERYQLVFPTALFDRTLPTANLSITLGGPGAGSTFIAARSSVTLGINMGNPLTDAWPSLTTARAAASDQDGDGDLAVSVTYTNGGGFSQPQTAGTLGAARASRGYLTERLRFTLNGSLSTCTSVAGNANAEAIDTHTVGCRLTNNNQCSTSQYTHLDTQAPNYVMQSSTFTMVRVAAAGTSVSCATIRAAIP